MEFVLENLEATERFARDCAAKLAPHTDGATVIALSGDLGAGKTTFTQYFAAAFGVVEPVTSPTYVIEKVYELTGHVFQRLVHVDAYRLNGAHELLVLGWEELLKDPQTLVLIEWPEKVAEAVPESAIRLLFEATEDVRTIHYDNKDF